MPKLALQRDQKVYPKPQDSASGPIATHGPSNVDDLDTIVSNQEPPPYDILEVASSNAPQASLSEDLLAPSSAIEVSTSSGQSRTIIQELDEYLVRIGCGAIVEQFHRQRQEKEKSRIESGSNMTEKQS
ncbi:hypothetical protein CPB84DRAFT_1801435 [Gymnopilus junonius]|uniref:Uncharacterized protein n=1 Tax=Gymnopilus junonius TaxID=109634 RepID=A0A9P5N796_GYMJU|nr:hypothetical protein CPB84DRAFT_1801435 [Gymnopilus junonius]